MPTKDYLTFIKIRKKLEKCSFQLLMTATRLKPSSFIFATTVVSPYFDRIDIVVLNNNFHFDEDSALHRARDANISEATVASLKIKKEADGRILLDADELFLSEALHRVSPWARPGGNQGPAFSLGNLNRNQSRVINKRAYPNNMDVVVDYVFNNANPTVRGSNAVTDPRSISIKLQHSFIALPENDFPTTSCRCPRRLLRSASHQHDNRRLDAV